MYLNYSGYDQYVVYSKNINYTIYYIRKDLRFIIMHMDG